MIASNSQQSGIIHPTAIIDEGACIGKNVAIGPYALVGKGSKIGDNCVIEAHVVIHENVDLGKNSFVGTHSILGEKNNNHLKEEDYQNPPLKIGASAVIRSHSIIYNGSSMKENFQTGNNAVIREESHFGKNCSFGAMSQSDGQIKVGDNCLFHNNVFISTFTTCEDNVHFYPMSCTVDSLHPPCQKGRQGPYLEEGVTVGAKVLLLPRIRLGKGCVIAGASVVTHDVEPYMIAVGAPAKIIKRKDEVRCHLEDRPAYDMPEDPEAKK